MDYFRVIEICQILISGLLVISVLKKINGVSFGLLVPYLVARVGNQKKIRIIDEKSKQGLGKAVLYFNQKRLKADIFGEFLVKDIKEVNTVKAMALGYYAKDCIVNNLDIDKRVVIEIRRIDNKLDSGLNRTMELVSGATVILLLIWQVVMIYKMSPMVVWPFLMLSLLNVIIWTILVEK